MVLSGSNWQSTVGGQAILPGPGMNFLHVRAADWGDPQMFIGAMSLDSPLAVVENRTQSLVTNPVS